MLFLMFSLNIFYLNIMIENILKMKNNFNKNKKHSDSLITSQKSFRLNDSKPLEKKLLQTSVCLRPLLCILIHI